MIVVYADGGGLGHLTRVHALQHSLGLTDDLTVLTSSVHADDERVASGFRVIRLPIRRDDRAARRSWLQRTLADLSPRALIVDAFPAGLGGEIDATAVDRSITTVHVARLLRWPAYRRVLPDRPLRYDHVHIVEPLHADHEAYLVANADRVDRLDLRDPPVGSAADGPLAPDAGWDAVLPPPSDGTAPPGRPRWLIVHSGPAAEVAELVAYARDEAAAEGAAPLLVVASSPANAPPPAPDLVPIDIYPVWPLFAGADRVFTAAGFNAMRQLAPHRARHRFLAMPRRFDDQPERARRARRELEPGSPTATTAPS